MSALKSALLSAAIKEKLAEMSFNFLFMRAGT
jgi:hypothetical protein